MMTENDYMSFQRFQRTLQGSMQYEFKGSVLTIRNYHTGERVSLDLSKMFEEEYHELVVEESEDDM